MNDYREEFERWYLSESIFNDVSKSPHGLKQASDSAKGIYCKAATRRAWAAWRAGIKQATGGKNE